MINLLKKTLLTGVGLAVVTKGKIEEIAGEFVKEGELTEKEGKAFVDDLLNKSDQARKDLESQITKSIQDAIKKLDIATKDDLTRLKTQIQKSEKNRKKLESKVTEIQTEIKEIKAAQRDTE